MFYLKTNISDNVEIKVDLYDDEIFTQCPDCGVEMEVETEILISVLQEGGDFSSTSIFCVDCTDKRKEETNEQS